MNVSPKKLDTTKQNNPTKADQLFVERHLPMKCQNSTLVIRVWLRVLKNYSDFDFEINPVISYCNCWQFFHNHWYSDCVAIITFIAIRQLFIKFRWTLNEMCNMNLWKMKVKHLQRAWCRRMSSLFVDASIATIFSLNFQILSCESSICWTILMRRVNSWTIKQLCCLMSN